MTSMATTMKPPMAPSGFRRANRSVHTIPSTTAPPIALTPCRSRAGFACATAEGGACPPSRGIPGGGSEEGRSPPPSLVSDARIEDGIERVDGEVHEDHGGDDHEVHPLDHRIVPLVDGVEEETAHAGQAEDRLDDDGPADDLGELGAQEGHHGDDGVAQAVLGHDDALG